MQDSDQVHGLMLLSQTVPSPDNCVLLNFHETFVREVHANLQKVTKGSLHSLQDSDQVRGRGSRLPDGTCPDNGALSKLSVYTQVHSAT